jgi:hypothetical protein
MEAAKRRGLTAHLDEDRDVVTLDWHRGVSRVREKIRAAADSQSPYMNASASPRSEKSARRIQNASRRTRIVAQSRAPSGPRPKTRRQPSCSIVSLPATMRSSALCPVSLRASWAGTCSRTRGSTRGRGGRAVPRRTS